MKQLPPGWELAILRAALDDAGFRYTERQGTRGKPILSFNYGPTSDQQLWFTAQAGPGALCFTAHAILAAPEPSVEQLWGANNVSIDWGLGRMFWAEGEFRAAATLFAYPDWAPPGGAAQFVCHHIWEARAQLARFATPALPAPPPIAMADVVAAITKRTGVKFAAREGRFTTRLDAGDGTCGIAISQPSPGQVVCDVMPLAAKPWPETRDALLRVSKLAAMLLRGAPTLWTGGQVIVRDAWPSPVLALDHPEWAGLMLDHAVTCAETVARAR